MAGEKADAFPPVVVIYVLFLIFIGKLQVDFSGRFHSESCKKQKLFLCLELLHCGVWTVNSGFILGGLIPGTYCHIPGAFWQISERCLWLAGWGNCLAEFASLEHIWFLTDHEVITLSPCTSFGKFDSNLVSVNGIAGNLCVGRTQVCTIFICDASVRVNDSAIERFCTKCFWWL